MFYDPSSGWRFVVRWAVWFFSPLLVFSLLFRPPRNTVETRTVAGGLFNYTEALQKSLYFYDAQRSGELPPSGSAPGSNRVAWRGPSGLQDGSDRGEDLTGGFYDAGDHVKFGLPMAASISMLAWSGIEYRQAFQNSGQWPYLLENLRWGSDYFVRAHLSRYELVGQVGRGSDDHAWWGPAEVMQMARPSFVISSTCPGSDLAGETSAALAATSIVFADSDPEYSALLLDHAEELFEFADTYRGRYSDCITDARDYYNSWSGYMDELIWSAAWLYRATGDSTYLSRAETYFQSANTGYRWTHSWDDKMYGSYVLLARLTGKTTYQQHAEKFLDYWTVGYQGDKVAYTPGGLAWLDGWGVLRYAANTAFLAFVYSDWLERIGGDPTRVDRYQSFAAGQVNYILGNNPLQRSYVVGLGSVYPRTPHHRTSHGSWADNISQPAAQRHILYGALVGGPALDDSFIDNRGDYVTNEVALDYNAGFTGALARMVQQYGGAPLTGFPTPETPDDDEVYLQGSVVGSGSNFTEVKVLVANTSGWPAFWSDRFTFRYYFTLEPGADISQISISSGYTQCKAPTSLKRYDTAGTVYALEVDCGGTEIFPGGASHFQKEVQFRLTSSGPWDPTNDWSYSGLAPQGSSPTRNDHMTLASDGVVLWGSLPGEEGDSADSATETDDTSTPAPDGSDSNAEPPPHGCGVEYGVTDDWGSGFVATVRGTHSGDQPLDGWTLGFAFAGNQSLVNLWNGVATQSGSEVSVDDADWNAVVAIGGTFEFGFQAAYSGSNTVPTRFVLNGVVCQLSPDGTVDSETPTGESETPDEVPEEADDYAAGCGLLGGGRPRPG